MARTAQTARRSVHSFRPSDPIPPPNYKPDYTLLSLFAPTEQAVTASTSSTVSQVSVPRVLRHYLPWETLRLICEHADEPTLVQLCLVSFGMLELAGPLLYEQIKATHVDTLFSLLFAPSPIAYTSRLRHHLGLHLLRSLALHIDSDGAPGGRARLRDAFPPNRVLASGILQLDSLSLQADSSEDAESCWLFHFYLDYLVQSFNPRCVEMVAHPDAGEPIVFRKRHPSFVGWKRLETVVSSGVDLDIGPQDNPVSFVSSDKLFPAGTARPRLQLDCRRSTPAYRFLEDNSLFYSLMWREAPLDELHRAARSEKGKARDKRPGFIKFLVSEKEDEISLLKAVEGIKTAWERALFKIILVTEQ